MENDLVDWPQWIMNKRERNWSEFSSCINLLSGGTQGRCSDNHGHKR